jgi:hypothetical protein
MYMGCSGATYTYTCFNIGMECIYRKIIFLALGFTKRDFTSAYGNGKMTSMKDCIG